MSKIRKNIEYYRLPTEVDTDMDSPENVATDFANISYGDISLTDRQIKNVATGTDLTDAANVGQLGGMYMFESGTRIVLNDLANAFLHDGNPDEVTGTVNLKASGVPDDASGVICNVYLELDRPYSTPLSSASPASYGAYIYLHNMDAWVCHVEQNMQHGDTPTNVQIFVPSISTTADWKMTGVSNIPSGDQALPTWSVKIYVMGYYINGTIV